VWSRNWRNHVRILYLYLYLGFRGDWLFIVLFLLTYFAVSLYRKMTALVLQKLKNTANIRVIGVDPVGSLLAQPENLNVPTEPACWKVWMTLFPRIGV
jgi:hypothetical protein